MSGNIHWTTRASAFSQRLLFFAPISAIIPHRQINTYRYTDIHIQIYIYAGEKHRREVNQANIGILKDICLCIYT